ncbi:uncharacterized protein LOC126397561 [Epinephelus moara]|uniref:uncharacterized protein LOC126397561 n=1 Tax=Epinephelus moara TaxID=300413 RepID=UPI00214E42FD|nr:uncharacterized protein LOC126397561 [Epinephelus moara]
MGTPTVTHLNGTPATTHPNGTPATTHPNGTPAMTHLNGTPAMTHLNGTPATTHLNGTPATTHVVGKSTMTHTEKFQIPWQKFPVKMMTALKEKRRPQPKDRRHMIRIVMEDMMASDIRPGRSKLKQVAQQLVERYPDSFLDQCGTNVVGQGFASLVVQMENRVENVRRQYGVITSPEERPKKKLKSSDYYGCSNWQPGAPNGSDYEEKKKMLQDAYKENLLSEIDIKGVMSETCSAQRITLNNQDNVIKVMEEWLYLFEATHLLDHTEKLIGFPVQTKLLNQIEEKGKTITEFLVGKGITGVTADPLNLLWGLIKYFGEEPKVLLLNQEQDALGELPSTPCIIIVDEGRYKLSVDEVTVNKNISCPLVAVSCMFSLFYVLNIKYPKEAALTLEFIQRSLLGINPERGSKSEKKGAKQYHISPKLLRFLSDLNDFQNPWKL